MFPLLVLLFWLLFPLAYALGAMGISTVITVNDSVITNLVTVAAGCILPLRSVWYIVHAKVKKTRIHFDMLVQTILSVALALTIIVLPRYSYKGFLVFLVISFSFYMTVQLINAIIYFKNRVFRYFIPAISQAVLFAHLLVFVFVIPADMKYSLTISGSYYLLSLLGHAYLCEYLAGAIRNKKVAHAFRMISVTMPGLSGLGVPVRLIRTIKSDEKDREYNIELIFNFGDRVNAIAGHCELCVDNITYTYGNYDPKSRAILQTMGNGIIFRADKEKYIDFLVKEEGRTIIVYGLKFNKKQRKTVRNNIKNFENTLVKWEDEARQTPKSEYINIIVEKLNASIYRIDEGRFKTYFLPTINCVTLTGSLLKGTSAGNIVVPGVYTPGAYLDYIHKMYLSGNDVVKSVKIYKPSEESM